MKYKDILVFVICLSFVITLYYFNSIQIEANAITTSDDDELYFWVGLVVIIISSITLFVFLEMQRARESQDFDGGRYWLSLYQHKNYIKPMRYYIRGKMKDAKFF